MELIIFENFDPELYFEISLTITITYNKHKVDIYRPIKFKILES